MECVDALPSIQFPLPLDVVLNHFEEEGVGVVRNVLGQSGQVTEVLLGSLGAVGEGGVELCGDFVITGDRQEINEFLTVEFLPRHVEEIVGEFFWGWLGVGQLVLAFGERPQ